MGKNGLSGFAIGGVTLFLLGAIALVPFSNCSQNPQNATTPKSAFLSPQEKSIALQLEFQARVSSSFCKSYESYSCMKKVYSASVESGQSSNLQECVNLSSDLRLCSSVRIVYFNTEAAQENCNGCQESYEYAEYSCHLRIPNSENLYPIVSTQVSLEKSLSDLHSFCQRIAEDSK